MSLKLNPEQLKAATHIEGPMMVLAGPGTGKTQIIAARITHILENTQLDPHNVLCLTFTESGVVAMRKRLLTMIGTAAYHVRIHTFHSFCNEVIKDWPEKFMFARELEPLTDVERVQLMRSLLEQLSADSPLRPFGDPYLYQNDVLRSIQSLKREDVSPEAFTKLVDEHTKQFEQSRDELEAFTGIHGAKLTQADIDAIVPTLQAGPLKGLLLDLPDAPEKKERTAFKNTVKKEFQSLEKNLPKQAELAQLYAQYQEQLRARGRYDFEDMILFVVDKFKNDSELLLRYQEQFQYILVDEYQDTNGAQNEVVDLIASYFENPNVFVVGDDKQSIYRFQGASLENLLYFYGKNREHIELVSLKQNYRSQQVILDSAHAMIQHNSHDLEHQFPGLDRELFANQPYPLQKVRVAELSEPGTEDYFVAKQIQALIEAGTSPSEIAVLYRNNWDVEGLMDIMLRLGIPFKLEAGRDILKDPKIKQLLQLLRLIQTPEEEHRLFEVLHYDFLGFRPIDIAKISRRAGEKRRTFFKTIGLTKELEELDLANPQDFQNFMEQLAVWKAVSLNKPFVQFFEQVLKESGFLDSTLTSEHKVEELNRLNSLFDVFKQLNKNRQDLNLADALEYLDVHAENKIAIKEKQLQTQKDAVRLMTAHKSKGLEFEHVFITRLVDKHWSNTRDRSKLKLPAGLLKLDIAPHERNEDERRLFYVALTRAKKSVTLSYSATNDSGRPQVPALFLEEISQELREAIDTQAIEEEALQRFQTFFLEPTREIDFEEEEFARSLITNYVMSVTHLNNYLHCPLRFYYQNLLRVPQAMNRHQAFGSAVHRALEDMHNKHKKEEALPSEDFLLERFEHHMKRQVLSEQDFRHGLDYGNKHLQAFYREHQNSFSPRTESEYNFSSHGVNLEGIPLTGKLDKVEIIDPVQRTVHVADYKTGNPDTKNAELKPGGNYHRQIVFYQMLANLSTSFPYQMLSGSIDFVQEGKKGFRKAVIHVGKEDLDRLAMEIKDTYQDIQELAFLKKPERWCGECEWCERRN